MAEVTHVFRMEGATFLASAAGPQLSVFNGTNFASYVALFDPSTIETLFLPFRAVKYPGNVDVEIDITWAAQSPTGNVVFGAALLAVTPEFDAADVAGEAFATEATATDTNLGAPAQRLHKLTITIAAANTDAMAEDDYAVLRIRRLATDGSDTLSLDAIVFEVAMRYNDS